MSYLSFQALSPFCNDSASRDVYNKIKHHVEVLEQSTVRVSSRAEVHGAVQQVRIVCTASNQLAPHTPISSILRPKLVLL